MNRIGSIQLFAEIKNREDRATYRGFDAESNQVVLVKIFTTTSIPDETTLARFHQEAAIYASLHHPNVARLVKFGVAEDRFYLALEFIEGQNLRALLKQRNILPNDVALCIALAILAGLKEIHRHDVIHRDLKPENIMIGNDGRVRICDFDLALKRQDRGNSPSTSLSGSPGYFAPEAILGEPVTTRSDLFALGIILYEMFTGAKPFAAATPSGEMNAVIRLPHLSPAKFNGAIPADFVQLINQLLAKSPHARPAGAAAILDQLAKQFQIPDAAPQTKKLQRFLNEPQTYQSESLAALPLAKPGMRRALAAARMMAIAALLMLTAAFVYQFFFRQNNAPAGDRAAPAQPTFQEAMARSRTDSLLRLIERISALDSTPPRPPGFKIEDVRTVQVPRAKVEKKPSPRPPIVKRLIVRSVPWAYLFVDGDSVGQMPRPEPLMLAAGVYQFAFKKPQFPPILFNVAVDSSTADTLFFSLWERVAQVEVKIYPWAEIFVNGVRQAPEAKTPVFYLLPGEHDFKFVHPQYGARNETLVLRAGEARQLEVNMFQSATENE